MQPSALAAAMAADLRPVLRHTAQQLTLLGRVVDLDDFSTEWLGEPCAYVRLAGLDMLELASAVNCLELGLGIMTMFLHTEWEEAETERDRWQANTRLTAARALLRNLRTWKRQQRWREIGLDD